MTTPLDVVLQDTEQQQTLSQPRVAVVTTQGCPYCKQAKAALQTAGIPYEELDVVEQRETLNLIKQNTGQSTVPQVFVGGKYIGGASKLYVLLEDGSFQDLVASAPADPLPVEVRLAVEESRKIQAAGQQACGISPADETRGAAEQLVEEMRISGPPRNDPPDKSFPLQAALDWVATARRLPPLEALAALSRLQRAQLLTVQAPVRCGRERSLLSMVPVLGRLLPSSSNSADRQGVWQREEDIPITAGLLQAQPDVRVRLLGERDLPHWLGQPLNTHFCWFGTARPAEQVAEAIRLALLRLYAHHMAGDGKKVDYTALRADPDWHRFVDATAELQKVEVSSLTRDARLAFFINIYNALVVHALAAIGPATGALGRSKWFGGIKYVIGGYEYSSNDIEHGVLRGNSPSPVSPFSLLGKPQWAGKTFQPEDPRAAMAISPVDPRIHFALNCGANSCPAIKVYSPDNLELGLASAAAAFCASEVRVYPERMELSLSMIFKWYAADFGNREELLLLLLRYLPQDSKKQLHGMLTAAGDAGQDIKLTYRPYGWGINSK